MTRGLCWRGDRATLDVHLVSSPVSDTGAPDGRHALVLVITLSAKVLDAAGLAEDDADTRAAEWVTSGDFLLHGHEVASADDVVGNPPYIRLEDVPRPIMDAYRRVVRGIGPGRGAPTQGVQCHPGRERCMAPVDAANPSDA